MSLDIATGFSNRTIFITGGTGFVGKVLLFKILKEFPDVRRIYLLMRGKKTRKFNRFLKAQERLELEVMGSPCFEPLRKSMGDGPWKALCDKVRAVDGDICRDHVGLSEKDRALLAREVNMVVHLAATVNFNERLDLAVQMNTLGGLRVLTLAKTFQHLEAMVHVSTCYVNYARAGREHPAEERIYPIEFDPEEMCKTILAMHPDEVLGEQVRLMKRFNFPNTYTFTKSMGEHLIAKYKEDVPLAIVRPSIIGCSVSEPMPGWVDALTAAGGLILTAGLGVVRELNCNGELIADIVPVDFVVNVVLKTLFRAQNHYKRVGKNGTPTTAIKQQQPSTTNQGNAIVAAAAAALKPAISATSANNKGSNAINTTSITAEEAVSPATAHTAEGNANSESFDLIFQVCTSSCENHTTWNRLRLSLEQYMSSAPRHPKSLSKCEVVLTQSSLEYRTRYLLLRYLPYTVLHAIAQLPEPIGSREKRKLVAKLGKAVSRAGILNREFHDFVLREWIYMRSRAMSLDDDLNERSRKAFGSDPLSIHWFVYIQLYMYGMMQNIVRDIGSLKLPVIPPTSLELFARASSL